MKRTEPVSAFPFAAAVTVVLTTAAARLAMVWSGWPETSIVADDAYYYFTIARNLAEGLGPTFDGLAPTNGFHPLWQYLLVPVFVLTGDSLWTPVRAALSLATVCDAVTALVLFWILRPHVPRGALLVCALWMVSPVTVILSLRGMEASLSTMLVVVLLAQLISPHWTQPRRALLVGLTFGLAVLARTDNLVTVGLATAVMVGRTRLPMRSVLLAMGAGVGVLAPWFAWSLSNFGSWIQVSGEVKLLAHEHFYGVLPWRWSSPQAVLDTLAHLLLAPLLIPLRLLVGEEFSAPRWTIVATIVTVVTWWGLGLGRWRRALRRAPMAGFAAAYVLAHTLLFGVIWRAYASWYALPTWAMLAILGALAFDFGRIRRAAEILLVATHLALWGWVTSRLPHGAAGPEARFQPLLEQARRLPPGTVLGAFDAGALGYVAGGTPGLTIVNLDGLVNNAVYEALQEDRYKQYLMENVDFLLQDPGKARMFLEPEDVEELRRHFQRRTP